MENIPFRICLYVIRAETVTGVVCGFPAVRKKSCGVVLRESSMEGKRASLYLLVMN